MPAGVQTPIDDILNAGMVVDETEYNVLSIELGAAQYGYIVSRLLANLLQLTLPITTTFIGLAWAWDITSTATSESQDMLISRF